MAPLRPQRGELGKLSPNNNRLQSGAPTHPARPPHRACMDAVVCKAQCSNKVAEAVKKAQTAAVAIPALVQAHPAFALVSTQVGQWS